jgi:hypothetical protein
VFCSWLNLELIDAPVLETERLACDQADLFLLEAQSTDCDSCLGEALQLSNLPNRQRGSHVRAMNRSRL